MGLLALTATLIVSCQRESFNVPIEIVSLPVADPVNDLFLFNDSLYAVSGKAVFHIPSSNSTITDPVFIAGVELYSMSYHKGEWFVGGDEVKMFRGQHLSAMKRHNWRESDWVSDLSKHPIRVMVSDSTGLLAIAGGKLSFGVLYHSYDNGNNWQPQEPENELRAAHICDGVAWVAGNGILLKSEWGTSEWLRLPLENQFVTGIAFKNREEGWLINQKGDILSTADSGKTWNRIHKGRSSFMHQLIRHNQVLIAVGNAGNMIVSLDSGKTWKRLKTATDADLLDAEIWGERCYVATSQGEIISFLIADLK